MGKSSNQTQPTNDGAKRVLILGGGFAGIAAARALKDSPVTVVLVDRRNHHIFQPLLYQVATAVLAPTDIAAPLRQLARNQANLSILLANVLSVDTTQGSVTVDVPEQGYRQLGYDFLVVATGSGPTYFGHDEFAPFAPGLKNLADAEAIRTRILSAFELAEQASDFDTRSSALTFILVGGGPTGVELAASIALMARVTLKSNFRTIDPRDTRIILLEGGPRILPSFDEGLSRKALDRLTTLGVEVRTGVMVKSVDEAGVQAGNDRIPSATVLWTAGVRASSLAGMLGALLDNAGRARVDIYLNVPGHQNVYVTGDAAVVEHEGQPLPGVAQVAIQQGDYASKAVAAQVSGTKSRHAFRYSDRGTIAVVGTNFAVFQRGKYWASGYLPWLLWALVHTIFLPLSQNRIRVQSQWFWSYLSGQRSSRVIPEPRSDMPTKR